MQNLISVLSNSPKSTKLTENKTIQENENNSPKFISILFEQIKEKSVNSNPKSLNNNSPILSDTKTDSTPKSTDQLLLNEILNILNTLEISNSANKKLSFPKFSDKIQSILNNEDALNDFRSIKNMDDIIKFSKKYNLNLEKLDITQEKIDNIKNSFSNLEKKGFFDINENSEISKIISKQDSFNQIQTNRAININNIFKNPSQENSISKNESSKDMLQNLLKNVSENSKKVIIKDIEEDKKNKVKNFKNSTEKKNISTKIAQKNTENKNNIYLKNEDQTKNTNQMKNGNKLEKEIQSTTLKTDTEYNDDIKTKKQNIKTNTNIQKETQNINSKMKADVKTVSNLEIHKKPQSATSSNTIKSDNTEIQKNIQNTIAKTDTEYNDDIKTKKQNIKTNTNIQKKTQNINSKMKADVKTVSNLEIHKKPQSATSSNTIKSDNTEIQKNIQNTIAKTDTEYNDDIKTKKQNIKEKQRVTIIENVKTEKIQTKQNFEDNTLKKLKQKGQNTLFSQNSDSSKDESKNLKENTNEIKAENSNTKIEIRPQTKTYIPQSKTTHNLPQKETFDSFANDLKEKMEQYKPPIMKVQMSLNPKNLGEVEVTILNRGNNLHVNITSNTNTITLFTQNQTEFKNSLVNMGFTNLEMNFSNQRESNKEQQKGNSSNKNLNEELEHSTSEEINSINLVVPRYI